QRLPEVIVTRYDEAGVPIAKAAKILQSALHIDGVIDSAEHDVIKLFIARLKTRRNVIRVRECQRIGEFRVALLCDRDHLRRNLEPDTMDRPHRGEEITGAAANREHALARLDQKSQETGQE